MTITSQHTPTLPKKIETGAGPDSLYLCEPDGGDVLADIHDGREDFRNALAYRYNAYEPMREALEGLCKEIRFLVDDGTLPLFAMNHPAMKAARAALALAEK